MPVLERAYAQWYQAVLNTGNGYDKIGNGGYQGRALTEITGKKTQEYDEITLQLVDTIKSALNQGGFVAAGTPANANSVSIGSLGTGVMVGGHAYSIHGVEGTGNSTTLLVRNPWNADAQNNSKENGFTKLTLDEATKVFDGISITLI